MHTRTYILEIVKFASHETECNGEKIIETTKVKPFESYLRESIKNKH